MAVAWYANVDVIYLTSGTYITGSWSSWEIGLICVTPMDSITTHAQIYSWHLYEVSHKCSYKCRFINMQEKLDWKSVHEYYGFHTTKQNIMLMVSSISWNQWSDCPLSMKIFKGVNH